MMKIKEHTNCRISGGKLIEILNLGTLPISCFPHSHDPTPGMQPLRLCLNKESGLVQLKHTVDPDAMYQEYWYMSGINQSMKVALHSIVEQAIKRSLKPLSKNDIVVDIASNDGTLLAAYPNSLFRVGIDPAKNIKPQACDLHINTYFSEEVYKSHLGEKKASIITSIAVFYDLEDPIAFARGVTEILKEDGLWIMEMSYLPTMVKNNAFETICAEHLEYYSLTSIEYILDRADLKVEDVELNDVNGGSFRLYIRHKKITRETSRVKKMREEEKKLKLCEPKIYEKFAQNIEKNKREMVAFLEKQKREGKKVLGYGASTKGNTILSYYGIKSDLLPFVADRNPMKWGRQTVTRIPIISEEEARRMKPDYFLVFPYHFINEFILRESQFLTSGGKFIIPTPKFTLYP